MFLFANGCLHESLLMRILILLALFRSRRLSGSCRDAKRGSEEFLCVSREAKLSSKFFSHRLTQECGSVCACLCVCVYLHVVLQSRLCLIFHKMFGLQSPFSLQQTNMFIAHISENLGT